MSLEAFKKRLESLGCTVTKTGNVLNVDVDENKTSINFEDEWKRAIEKFYKARQYRFDLERCVLIANRSAEFQLTRLDPVFFLRNEHKFKDKKGNVVCISPATKAFLLSYYESDRYEAIFHRIKERIIRRCKLRKNRSRSENRISLRPDDILPMLYTAQYVAKRKPRKKDIDHVAVDRIRACLFSLAQSKGECWEIRHDIKYRGLVFPKILDEDSDVMSIPSACYEPSVVSYYKVAKSSQFPGQVFLSFYHILEYHFLRVADETLFSAVRSKLNDPGFQASYENVSRLVATIKKNDSTTDEKKMLRDVLDKYVPEEDFIDFVKALEQEQGEKIFSAAKQSIFGEELSIKLEKGHALSNTAALLKHIRNALVHSSDRYSRDDCFLPFSESEKIVVKYLPLIQYLAERVIFATAE